MQRPGSKGVFISGIKPGKGSLRGVTGFEAAIAFSFRGSCGLAALEGISHDFPNLRTPSIRPSAQYFCTSRSEIFHFFAACCTVMYSISNLHTSFWAALKLFATPHTFKPFPKKFSLFSVCQANGFAAFFLFAIPYNYIIVIFRYFATEKLRNTQILFY